MPFLASLSFIRSTDLHGMTPLCISFMPLYAAKVTTPGFNAMNSILKKHEKASQPFRKARTTPHDSNAGSSAIPLSVHNRSWAYSRVTSCCHSV